MTTLLLIAFTSCTARAPDIAPARTEMIPMRDGVRLATDIYLPAADATGLPVILIRTPYGRTRYNGEYGSWARWGYAIAIQDLRGRFDSEGRAIAFVDDGWGERQDGAATIAWLARQPFSNGKVGTVGASAMGIAQNLLAPAAPDALICQYILVAASNLYPHSAYPGGIFAKDLAEGWLRANKYDESLEIILAHPLYDEFWRGLDATREAPRVRAAAIHYGGWFDPFLQGTIDGFVARVERSPEPARSRQKLVIGPWLHGGPSGKRIGEFDMPENARRNPPHISPRAWFDHWLKEAPNGADAIPAVTYYVMGPLDAKGPGNEWRTADRWPPASIETSFFLHRDRGLRADPPAQGSASLEYEHDPKKPVPTIGGANLVMESRGPRDQRPIESRPDVLVFSTEVLKEAIEVTGPVRAHLWIKSSARDADVCVRLADVYPDGRSILICDGARRASLRDGFERAVPLQPGVPAQITVDVGSTSMVFAPGHRIRIIVSSTNYPRFDADPNPSRVAILVEKEHPSRIVLPTPGTAQWEAFRKPRIDALRRSLGRFPAEPPALDARVTGTIEGDGFAIDNVVFRSRPGLWVTANLYRPEHPQPSMPGILISHSHHTPKEHGEIQDMGMTWARAGCLFLAIDHLGHGERRQHPFVDAGSYAKPYRAGRQDYYFRYDMGIQLHLAGESLIGWMVWDLMRGVDLLLSRKGIDPRRIILLGAVAGGGDPAAVAATLDDRIAAAAPFNFGGPQPETSYPLPEDSETSFDYAGSGSWESTRNLRLSVPEGFLPWVIVGGIAPRRLVYAHEFSWDRERDPVWKRLQAIYDIYGCPENLACTHGGGVLQGRPPEATHCTHIGATHRRMIHEAFRRWFSIEVVSDQEFSRRLPPDRLRAMTADLEGEIRPRKLIDILDAIASERIEEARRRRTGRTADEARGLLREDWTRILGGADPRPETDVALPAPVLLMPEARAEKPPVLVAFSQAGSEALRRARAAEIAALLAGGVAVCLPDLPGTGGTAPGAARGRTSEATARSSTQLMQGETAVGEKLRELRSILRRLRTRDDVDGSRIALWGDSLAPVNAPDTDFAIPRDDDDALPAQSEPLGGLLALLAALYEDTVQAVYARGGLASFRSVLGHHLVLIPHDIVVPGVLTTGDLSDIARAIAPRPLRLEGLVDGLNRRIEGGEPSSPAPWLLAQLGR